MSEKKESNSTSMEKDIHIRIPVRLLDVLKKSAKSHNMNLSNYIRYVLINDCRGTDSQIDLLSYELQNIKKVLELIFLTTDTHARFFNRYLVAWFAYQPKVPEGEKHRDFIEAGANRFRKFIESYIENTNNFDQTYLYSIFGNLIKSDGDYLKYYYSKLIFIFKIFNYF